ncbi:hypothetical protein ACTFIY_005516 [Dictyostelium cf. discoideum]
MIVTKKYCGAAGIFPYTVFNDKIYLLIGYERRGYSDFGGYREGMSESTLECACREFSEETLGCFSMNKDSRGSIDGVIESTIILSTILNNKELHTSGLVNKVLNPRNQYEMFVCPVNRFLRRNEFKYTYDLNRNKSIEYQIECTEKRDIYWIDIDSIIISVETDNPQIRCNKGHIYNLYTAFFNTLKEQSCIEHLKYLRSTYQKDTNLLYSLITDIYSSQKLLNNLPKPSLNNKIIINIGDDDDDDDDNDNSKFKNYNLTTTTTTTTKTTNIQPNIKQIQQTLFNKFNK